MYDNLKLFRRRFIPDELVFLHDDEILSVTEDKIVTRWQSLNPRNDFAFGESTYYRKKGLKVTRVMDKDKNFLHWYIDVVRECGAEALQVGESARLNSAAADYLAAEKNPDNQVIVYEDLLLDLVVLPNGLIEIRDMDEIMDVYEQGVISEEILRQSMNTCYSYAQTLYSRYGKIPFDSPEYVAVE